jgi:hypothetical protein
MGYLQEKGEKKEQEVDMKTQTQHRRLDICKVDIKRIGISGI